MMVQKALEASKQLEEEGISVIVINMSTIKPIDREIIIKAAKETKGIVTVPFKILNQMLNHPLTTAGIDRLIQLN